MKVTGGTQSHLNGFLASPLSGYILGLYYMTYNHHAFVNTLTRYKTCTSAIESISLDSHARIISDIFFQKHNDRFELDINVYNSAR